MLFRAPSLDETRNDETGEIVHEGTDLDEVPGCCTNSLSRFRLRTAQSHRSLSPEWLT